MFPHKFDQQQSRTVTESNSSYIMTKEDEARLRAIIENTDFADENVPKRTNELSEEDVTAISRVLGIVERQLREVNTDVEVSVNGVCEGFSGMADRAQSAIRSAKDALGSGRGALDGQGLITEMRSVLAALVFNIRSSREFSQSISRRLNELEDRFSAVSKAVENIETIAHKVKFVAFNTRIEAVRIGDRGNALAIVAREIAQLAGDAAESNDTIRNLVENLSTELQRTSEELKTRTEIDAGRVVESELSANSLLDDIARHNDLISESLAKTEGMTHEMRADIANAVMNMQFQDRVSQRICHVIDTIGEVATRIRALESDSGFDSTDSVWIEGIKSRYTMDSERWTHNLECAQSPATSKSTSSVELF